MPRKGQYRNKQSSAEKVVHHLLHPKAFIKQIDTNRWGVFGPGKQDGRVVMKIPTSEIIALQSADFIKLTPDGLCRITDAGRKWQARRSAADTPFAAQHQHRIPQNPSKKNAGQPTVSVNQSESPLCWLYNRKDKAGKRLLSEQQFSAGEQLRRDFTNAHLGPKITSSWSPVSGSAPPSRKYGSRTNHEQSLFDSTIAARKYFNDAIEAVGPEFADILIETCCFLHGVEDVEGKFGWPRRSGKLVLQLALSTLARHYDANRGAVKSRKSSLRFWGEENYRPEMFPSPENQPPA